MVTLTIIYEEVESDIFSAHVVEFPHIVAFKIKGLQLTEETMYHLITEEMFYIYHNLRDWSITKEIINYLDRKKIKNYSKES